jgi:hypothetical protein
MSCPFLLLLDADLLFRDLASSMTDLGIHLTCVFTQGSCQCHMQLARDFQA